ncbi:MAG TPA: glycosyltransferase family 4 protein [Longimicrobiaceae bacterium]
MPLQARDHNSHRVRLCLATQAFYPVYAGPAVRFGRYLPGFRARNVEVEVFAGTPSTVKAAMSGVQMATTKDRLGTMLPAETVLGVPTHRVRMGDAGPLRRSMIFSRRLVDFCRHPQHRPDVIQLLSLSFVGLPALRRLRSMGIPLVYTSTMLPEEPASRIRTTLQRGSITIPFKLLDCVVVSSRLMLDRLRALGVETRIEVIPNGVDTERFRPASGADERQALRSALGIAPEDTVLLFVGPVSPRKGIDLLLEGWCELARDYPRLHLLIVGPRRDESDPSQAGFARRLEMLLNASGAADRVHFVGLVENVEEYMRAADVFVFPSRREGMPNVVPEAMASGLPVVCTPFIGLPAEFGTAERQYLLASFDPRVLARRIAEVVGNTRMREELGHVARRWVEDRMAVTKSLDQYVDLYRGLAIGSDTTGVRR